MLQIRSRQMEGLSSLTMSRKLAAHWRESFPQRLEAVTQEALLALAAACRDEALAIGIAQHDDIQTYGDFCIAAGSGFAAQAPLRRSAA